MFDLRLLIRPAKMKHGGAMPFPDEKERVLQYRYKEPKYYGVRDEKPSHMDWSEWKDVPTVEST